jgi:protein phosphatase
MPASETVEINSYSITHVGNVREDNQDSVRLCDPDDEITNLMGHLYGIADGMGGYSHGGVASSLALETLFETFYSRMANGATPIQKFRVGIQNANLNVYQSAQKLGAGRMGTTLTAINIIGHSMYIGHIGDSRAYLIRNNKVQCLTDDHTRVGELVRMRLLSPDKVRTHNQRSVLNKCLGLELFIQPDIFKVQVEEEDVLILCTDGVWTVIEDEELAEFLKTKNSPEKLCKHIVELALERDSDDNLSVIVLSLDHLSQQRVKEEVKPSWSLSGIIRRIVK